MPRFVILRHTLPAGDRQGTHFDLMLEDDGKLLTWALPELPRAGDDLIATQLPDHRIAYLDYEGPISDDRGEVERVDEGEFVWLERGDEKCQFEMRGRASHLLMELHQVSASEWRIGVEASR